MMSKELYQQFPVLRNFRSAVQRCDVSKSNADSFNKWRTGKKCLEGSPQRAEADLLWNEYQQIKDRAKPPPKTSGKPPDSGQTRGKGPAPVKAVNQTAASPAVLGNPFHNPYTFIPFPDSEPHRDKPTPLTADELEPERFTGILELTVRTLSPLMVCNPLPLNPKEDHKIYPALTINSDVVVPATGIRGSLRSLMTILAGGNLGYLDEGLWLCQGRDAQLGPAGKKSPQGTPRQAFLACVERPGNANHSGTIRLGETRLVKTQDLERACRDLDKKRPRHGQKIPTLWVSSPNLERISTKASDECPWQVKLSGLPVNRKGKREGLFRAGSEVVELGSEFWQAYLGRNRHGDHPELRKGDLVWLEPVSSELARIRSAADVKSIQWARWGRRGTSLKELLGRHSPHMIPDSLREDGMVDEITNLFGQVPLVNGAAGPFAGRIRPDNLVFGNCATQVDRTTLAPLAPPHPGCVAFYRDNEDIDSISTSDSPKGYKVYRNTEERGPTAPWNYETQGVYNEHGRLKPSKQKVNKTCDLLREGVSGVLRLSVRSLSVRELGMLLVCCAADWRLGGGKPLGLGHCRVTRLTLRDEDGAVKLNLSRGESQEMPLPEEYTAACADLLDRLPLWQTTQIPVPFLRYPRAVSENSNGLQRGGHVWFQRYSAPKKTGKGGLEVVWAENGLKADAGGKEQIRAQSLRSLDDSNDDADQLYGYDSLSAESARRQEKNKVWKYSKLERFNPEKHQKDGAKSGGFHGQNAESRKAHKENRRDKNG